MTGHAPFGRRELLRRLGRYTPALGGLLLLPGTVPQRQGWPSAASTCPGCGLTFGPLHRLVWQYGADPWWQDAVIYRESRYDPGAYNRASGAAGLAQFIPSTWADGQRRFGIYGSPQDPYAAVAMMSAYIRAGERWHWNCNGERGCYDI